MKCMKDVAVVQWICDPMSPMGECQSCGGPVHANPFATFSSVSLEPLMSVLDRPLAEWGVERYAVIELAQEGRRTAFVIGGQK